MVKILITIKISATIVTNKNNHENCTHGKDTYNNKDVGYDCNKNTKIHA